jgi:hypothetical protein
MWADEQVYYYPLHVRPYTPAARLAGGKHHPAFRTKPQLALELVLAARAAGILSMLAVCALKPAQVVWTPPPEPESPWAVLWEAADRLSWTAHHDAARPGAWTVVVRRFHDGHEGMRA